MIGLDVTSGDRPRTFLRETQLRRIAAVHANRHLLEAEKDVDDVLLNTLDAGVLVEYALDLRFGDCGTGHG